MIQTERLLLRQWRDEDREPFAALNADPEVMEFYQSTLTRDESDASFDRINGHLDRNRWGLWAVEIAETKEFAGYTGLWPANFPAHFTPAVEVGWRLARPHWGHGYATEAARAAIEYGTTVINLDEILSFTSEINHRSRRVMEKLGMTHDPSEDFEHPGVPEGHVLRRHVLYRLQKPQ